MAIEKISREEFESLPKPRTPAPETTAILRLAPGEGVKFPCHWKHSRTNQGHDACGGLSMVHQTGRRHGIQLTCRCYQGTLYVLRLA